MAGWNEVPTTPDLTDWLTGLTEQDWEDWALANEATPIRRTVAHRDGRTPLEYYDHRVAGGMTPSQAKPLTETWMAGGGDQTTYSVSKLPDQKRPNEPNDRPKFAGLYRGGPRLAEAESCGRRVKTERIDAKALAREWREMRKYG